MRRLSLSVALLSAVILSLPAAQAQQPPGPPAVGVVKAEPRPITETSEFVGRIQATDRVDIVARVTGFIDQQLFSEGGEVRKGDLLYRLERGPFEADVQAKQATVAQYEAQLRNARLTLERAQALINTPAGIQSRVDQATSDQRSIEAQSQGAGAQLRQSQINLAYTLLQAPINGKIGRTAVTVGNVVSPSSGVLTTIVSQDPMYVTFPISVRAVLELRARYGDKGGFHAVVIKLRLPDGRIYGQPGKLEFADNRIATNTDTILLRGTVVNPVIAGGEGTGVGPIRELIDGEFVTVLLEGAEPVQLLAIPRSAVLSDQAGDFVYVVGDGNKAERRNIRLGQSTPTEAVIASGLNRGETVVVEGLQRVKPGQPVNPGPPSATVPAAAQPGASATQTGKS